MTKDALAQPEQKQTGIREIRVTETVKQEQEEDWGAMGQKILAATARDTKRTWEDAAVKAVHKLMQEEQEPVGFYVYKPTLPRGHLGNVSDGDLPWVYDQDPSSGYSARMLVYTTPPVQPEQEIDWKDMYEKEKRRSAMWLAKYEAVAGPAPKAYPQSQSEQEPFTYYNPVRDAIRPFKADGDIPLYTTPPKPAWVGLMVAEMEELTLIAGRMGYTRMLQLAEAKLKELNT